MLTAAYMRYALRCSLSSELLSDEDGHKVLKVSGANVYKRFKHEAGKHAIQSRPPTEHNGRVHTSMVSVAVLPLPPDNAVTPIPEADLEESFQTGKQKAGGQNVNKVNSAVRLKHIPTGISVFINGRDQTANRKQAKKIIAAKVHELTVANNQATYNDSRKAQLGGGTRGDKIRTYNFINTRAVDHRTGLKTRNVDAVLLKGQFDLLLGDKV